MIASRCMAARKLTVALAATLGLMAACMAPAAGATALAPGLSNAQGAEFPVTPALSMTVPPPKFTSNGDQALAAVKRNGTMLALHAHEHPLNLRAMVLNDYEWYIPVTFRGKLVALVVENRAAHVTHVWTGAIANAPYAQGDYAPLFGHWWILVPFSLLFLVPFVDPRRWRRLVHLDALVILSWLVSYLLFSQTHLVSAVWLVYPPMLYLLGRMLWVGLRSGGGRVTAAGLSPLLSIRTLAIGLGLLFAARTAIGFISYNVMDVGYGSVIGAHHILAGQSIYFADPAHTDTYGPITYLAYVPFELLFPWHGTWDYLPSAHVASFVFDLVTVVGLVALGRRLRPGQEGLRLGLAMGWAWSACPFTLLGMIMHTNDGLIAMLSVLSLLAFSSPPLRGALLGLAAAAKFAPAALLGLYAGQRDRGVRGVLLCVGAFAVVVVVSIGLYLPPGGLSEFYNHTLHYQFTRSDVFSLWGLHPTLVPLQTAIEVLVVGLCALVAFVPRHRRSMVEVCALAAAVTLAVQLPAKHWFYYYIIWFLPFALVALLAQEPVTTSPVEDRTAVVSELELERVPVAV
jgi:hypothetical protein